MRTMDFHLMNMCVKSYCSIVDGQNPAQKGQHFVIVCAKRLSFPFESNGTGLCFTYMNGLIFVG